MLSSFTTTRWTTNSKRTCDLCGCGIDTGGRQAQTSCTRTRQGWSLKTVEDKPRREPLGFLYARCFSGRDYDVS